MEWTPSDFFAASDWNRDHHPPAKLAQIHDCERRLGIVFPETFQRLFLLHDGGYTDKEHYIHADGTAGWLPDRRMESLENIQDMDYFFRQADWDARCEDYFHDALDAEKRKKLIVFARHAWNQFICLDYRDPTRHEPVVVELDLDIPGILQLAPTIASFLAMLKTEEDSIAAVADLHGHVAIP